MVMKKQNGNNKNVSTMSGHGTTPGPEQTRGECDLLSCLPWSSTWKPSEKSRWSNRLLGEEAEGQRSRELVSSRDGS